MKWPSLNLQILLGAVFGVALGAYFHDLGASHPLTQGGVYAASLLGTLLIDLLKMILIPLVFCSIAVGIANLRQHQQMHRGMGQHFTVFYQQHGDCYHAGIAGRQLL